MEHSGFIQVRCIIRPPTRSGDAAFADLTRNLLPKATNFLVRLSLLTVEPAIRLWLRLDYATAFVVPNVIADAHWFRGEIALPSVPQTRNVLKVDRNNSFWSALSPSLAARPAPFPDYTHSDSPLSASPGVLSKAAMTNPVFEYFFWYPLRLFFRCSGNKFHKPISTDANRP